MAQKNVTKYFSAIDIAKFLFAISIMFAHICSENVVVHPLFKSITSIYNFAVPFFYATSGFLFFLKFKKIKEIDYKNVYIKFTKRILLMYFVWSSIYFLFILFNWINDGVTSSEVISYFHKALVFTTYGTIWFLPSLWIGVSITYLLITNKVKFKYIITLALLFYLIGSMGYSYYPLVKNTFLDYFYIRYNEIMITTRNGFFSGFPFVVIGAYIAYNGTNKKTIRFNFVLTFIFSFLYILEAIFIKYKMHTNVDMGLLLLPAIYYMLNWLIDVKITYRPLYSKLRNLSMLIFLGQRLFITAIPSVLPTSYMDIITKNNYVGLFVFILQILVFALLIEFYSKRYKWLKVLW